jgi:hypothetical protein
LWNPTAASLYKRPDYLRQYTALTDELEATLAANGWRSATALSESPTWGGGSWMAYTSAMFGLNIDSDPEYSMLMDRYQVDDFPDLGGFLRDQGYRYYGLSSIALELPDEKWGPLPQILRRGSLAALPGFGLCGAEIWLGTVAA